MHAQLEGLKMPYVRFPAVDGRSLPRETIAALASPLCQLTCTPSMIGCALSHMSLWQVIQQQKHKLTLILEDDAQLVPDFVPRLKQALRDVPRDFDVLVLGCFFLCNKGHAYEWPHSLLRLGMKTRQDTRTWGSVFVPEAFRGTHCYIVSLQGAHKLAQHIPRVKFHIDVQMNHPAINIYAASPDLAFQKDMSESSIAGYAFPRTLLPVLSRLRDSKNISAAYYLEVPMGQVAGKPINSWTLVFFVLGAALQSRAAWGALVAFFVLEVALCGDITAALASVVLGRATRLLLFKR